MNYTENVEAARGIPLQQLVQAMFSLARTRWREALGLLIIVFGVAAAYTLLRPREYIASMVVTPVESSVSDPTSLISSAPFAIRGAFNLGGQAPPQMAAFIITLKSPELARRLTADPAIVSALATPEPGMLGSLFSRPAPAPSPDQLLRQRIQLINTWMITHVTVDQDVDVAAWTIHVRDGDADMGLYILNQIHDVAERILREAAISQFEKQREFDMKTLKASPEETDQQTAYQVLETVNRSLLVLKSGSNVATVVLSKAYVPPRPEYPPRILSFAIAFLPGIILLFGLLGTFAYRDLARRRASAPREPAVRLAKSPARASTE